MEALGVVVAHEAQHRLEVVDLVAPDELEVGLHRGALAVVDGGHCTAPFVEIDGVGWFGVIVAVEVVARRARIPGMTNARTRARVSSGSAQIGARGGIGQVGEHDPHGPLGRPRGLVGREPAGEERGGEVPGHEQDPVHVGERQTGQDHPRLVEEQEGQGAVIAQAAGRFHHAGHQDVFQIGGLAHDDGQRREEAGHLGLHDGRDDGVLAAGEGPVEGRPGELGLAGDVVDRGLAQALAGQAGQGGIDDADPGRGAVVGAEVMEDLSPVRRSDDGHPLGSHAQLTHH